eukprot:366216-Chlamydomonas_euryale.AAC.2
MEVQGPSIRHARAARFGLAQTGAGVQHARIVHTERKCKARPGMCGRSPTLLQRQDLVSSTPASCTQNASARPAQACATAARPCCSGKTLCPARPHPARPCVQHARIVHAERKCKARPGMPGLHGPARHA